MDRITELRAELDMARRELVCADMIDSTARRDREVEYWKHRVGKLEDQLAKAQKSGDPVNLAGSGPVPIEPREG